MQLLVTGIFYFVRILFQEVCIFLKRCLNVSSNRTLNDNGFVRFVENSATLFRFLFRWVVSTSLLITSQLIHRVVLGVARGSWGWAPAAECLLCAALRWALLHHVSNVVPLEKVELGPGSRTQPSLKAVSDIPWHSSFVRTQLNYVQGSF